MGQLGEGGEEIPEGANKLALAAGFDLAWPANQQGLANSAFVELAFVAPKRTICVEEVRDALPLVALWPVVGAEEHNRVFVQVELLQQRHDLADAPVQAAPHARVGGIRFGRTKEAGTDR